MVKPKYLVTARKYRPQRFSGLVAQSHVAQALTNAFKLDRLAHAYLFTGPRGVGKTTAARILAKAINCTGKQDGEVEPCCACPSCLDFESQRSLSIFEIDAASNNKVEDIRELRENIRIPPQGGRRKVYIIDEVHMLSNAAFNALLKTLEEPPPHVLFIFATTEPHKVLPTILSRCQRFDFRRIPTSEIVLHLTMICEQENITVDEDALHLIAHKGDGSLRDALSTFDQAVALCGSVITYSTLAEAFRTVDVEFYFEATQHITDRASGPILSLAERVTSEGYDIKEFLDGLAEHLRNLLITITLGEAALVDISRNLRDRYAKTGKHFTETVLLRLLMIVDETQIKVPVSSSPRLTLELSLLKMVNITSSIDLSKALEQIHRLERSLSQNPQPTHRQQPASKPETTPPVKVSTPSPPRTSAPPTRPIQEPDQKQFSRSSMAIGGRPALELRKQKASTRTEKEPTAEQPQTEPQTARMPSAEEYWNQIVPILESHTEVRGISTLTKSIPLALQGQVLQLGVRNKIDLNLAEGPVLSEIINQALKKHPDRIVTSVQFKIEPERFPPLEANQEDLLQKLKEKTPTIQQLDSAFGLRLVPSTTP